MKEIKRDLFDCISDHKAICITTNGQYENGKACMYGGCAKVCADRWPQTSTKLAQCLKNFGTNVPFILGMLDDNLNYMEPNLKLIKADKYKCLIFSFPTIDDLIDGAKIELIKRSAEAMRAFADRFQLMSAALGRPGTGIGNLPWADVKPVVAPYLDDRFTIVSFAHEE